MSASRWICPACKTDNMPEIPRCLRCKGYRPQNDIGIVTEVDTSVTGSIARFLRRLCALGRAD